jgi:tyrosyl-DNA phosphodiesterase-1
MAESSKRPLVIDDGDDDDERETQGGTSKSPFSLTNPISPPRKRSRPSEAAVPASSTESKVLKSPFQLTAIRDLPAEANQDALSLTDILGDPLIAECWQFNYLHDIDFVMKAFDEDVRSLVKVHVVHGFWKKEDPNRQHMQVGLDVIHPIAIRSIQASTFSRWDIHLYHQAMLDCITMVSLLWLTEPCLHLQARKH